MGKNPIIRILSAGVNPFRGRTQALYLFVPFSTPRNLQEESGMLFDFDMFGEAYFILLIISAEWHLLPKGRTFLTLFKTGKAETSIFLIVAIGL